MVQYNQYDVINSSQNELCQLHYKTLFIILNLLQYKPKTPFGLQQYFDCVGYCNYTSSIISLSIPEHIQQIWSAVIQDNSLQQIQMINQYRSTSLSRHDDLKPASISEVYDQIMRNFDKQALRIRFKFSNPSFDDALLVRPRKTLPKIQVETQKKGRMKFYSNKLVVNQAVYINQRRQYTPRQLVEEQFNKLPIPHPKEISILSDRNKRIMELYRRAEKDSEHSPMRIKFTQRISQNKVLQNEKQKEQQTNRQLKKNDLLRSSEKKMIDILKQANEKKKQQQQQSPLLRPQRSKSNIIINSYSTQPQNPQKHTLEAKKIQQAKQLQKQRVQTMKRIKYEPKRQGVVIKRKFNWKNQPLTLNKIDREEFQKLIRCYLGIGQPLPIPSGFYKAYVGYGNNCALIKKLIKDRGYWTIVDSLDQEPNFVWTQIRSSKFSSTLKSQPKQFEVVNRSNCNHQENVELAGFIKSKRNEYVNGCQKIFENHHFLSMMNQIKQRFQLGNNIQYFNRLRQVYVDYLQDNRISNTQKQLKAVQFKLHNHMQNSGAIGDKKQLLYMIEKYCEIFGEKINQLIPETVHLENSENSNQIFDKIPEGPWILKPGEATNRGQGITIHTNKQSLLTELGKKKKHKGGVKFTNIIQKYIQPLLYYGRKFDIRVWVLWTGRRLWWYRQGYLRTSSKQFTLKSLNKFIHLTNDAIQSQSEDFGKFEPANKLSFNQFEKYLETQHNYKSFYSQMLEEMKKLAVKAFRMGNLVFDNQNKQHCFELFGLDFLIDNKFKPWLIECNTNPCLEINCSLLARLVPNMLQNVMNLTIDSYFPVPAKKRTKEPQVWNHQPFKFELLYNGNMDVEMQQKLLTSNIKIVYEQPEPQIEDLQKEMMPIAQSEQK